MSSVLVTWKGKTNEESTLEWLFYYSLRITFVDMQRFPSQQIKPRQPRYQREVHSSQLFLVLTHPPEKYSPRIGLAVKPIVNDREWGDDGYYSGPE